MQAAIAAMVIGAGTKAYAGFGGANAERSEYNAQARTEEMNASIQAYQARAEYERLSGQKRRTLSLVRAAFASNGVTGYSGSAEDITMDTAIQLELDARNTRYRQTAVTEVGRDRAASLRKAGKNAYKTGLLTTIGGVVSDAGSIYAGAKGMGK